MRDYPPITSIKWRKLFFAAALNIFVCNQIWQRNLKHICLRNYKYICVRNLKHICSRNLKHICARTNLKSICWPRNLIYFQSESNVYIVNTDNKENYVTKWEQNTQKGWNCYIATFPLYLKHICLTISKNICFKSKSHKVYELATL